MPKQLTCQYSGDTFEWCGYGRKPRVAPAHRATVRTAQRKAKRHRDKETRRQGYAIGDLLQGLKP